MNIDTVRTAIEQGNRKFGEAAARRDYGGMAALYTENAEVLPPDAAMVTGRPAIEEFWRTAASSLGLTDATLKTVDLEVSGDTTYEVGEANLKLGTGEATVKYLVVWKRGGDGHWRLHRDIWNNMPKH